VIEELQSPRGIVVSTDVGVVSTNKNWGIQYMIGRADLFPCTTAILSFIAVAGFATPALGQDLPNYWKGLVGTQATTREVTATSNILALNTSMFDLYDSAGQIFTKNILANQPVILALFSGSGGTFTLYRPGQPPLQAIGADGVSDLKIGRS